MDRIIAREIQGRILREMRNKTGITQRTAAKRAGTSASYISELERGIKEMSSEHLWSLVVRAYNLTLSELYEEISKEMRRMEDASRNNSGFARV